MRFTKINNIPKDFPINQSTADRSYNKKQFIPKEIVQIVWEQYAKDFPINQSTADRIGERGGFGWYEIVFYLYSRIMEFENLKEKLDEIGDQYSKHEYELIREFLNNYD